MFKVRRSSQQGQDLSSETFVELLDEPGIGTVEAAAPLDRSRRVRADER
jgi:hypothetical protein